MNLRSSSYKTLSNKKLRLAINQQGLHLMNQSLLSMSTQINYTSYGFAHCNLSATFASIWTYSHRHDDTPAFKKTKKTSNNNWPIHTLSSSRTAYWRYSWASSACTHTTCTLLNILLSPTAKINYSLPQRQLVLSAVLLGLRAAFKEDIHTSRNCFWWISSTVRWVFSAT